MKLLYVFAFAVAATIPLAGCASTGVTPMVTTTPAAPAVTPGAPYKLSAAQIEAVKAGVKQSLKDPTSPLFGNMAASRKQGEDELITVCGYVNAKNSYGGYVGDQPFIGGLATTGGKSVFVVIGMGGSETDTQVTMQICQQSGVSF